LTRSALHPGEHLAEQLSALKMSAAELGRRLKVPGNRISGILSGRRAVTGDTALRLGHFFGTSPGFWLELQATYDLRIAEEKAGRTISGLPRLNGFPKTSRVAIAGSRIKRARQTNSARNKTRSSSKSNEKK
jgi:addiction module HigA family antidote